MFSTRDEHPERPGDPAVRRANLKRVAALFRPYRFRLSIVLGLILFSAAIGVVPAFLLRSVLQAIQRHDTTALSIYAGGMIAMPASFRADKAVGWNKPERSARGR